MKMVILTPPHFPDEDNILNCFEYESIEALHDALATAGNKLIEDAQQLSQLNFNTFEDDESFQTQYFDRLIRPYSVEQDGKFLYAGRFIHSKYSFSTQRYTYEYVAPEIYSLDEWFEKNINLLTREEILKPGANDE